MTKAEPFADRGTNATSIFVHKIQWPGGVPALEAAADQAVQNAILLNPKLSAAGVAALLRDDISEESMLAQWVEVLLAKDLAARFRKLKAEARRLEREKQFTFAFPAVREHLSVLPFRLREGSLLKTDYRKYLAELNSQQRDHQKNDKRRVAVQSILKLFPKGRKNRGLTLAEVDALKAKRAGLL